MTAKNAKKSEDKSLAKEVRRLKWQVARRRSEIRKLVTELAEVRASLFHSDRQAEVHFFQLVQAMQVACVMSVPFLENRSMEQTLEFFEHIAKTMGYDPAELRPALRMVLMRGGQRVIEMHTEPVEGDAPSGTVVRKDIERALKSPRLAAYI